MGSIQAGDGAWWLRNQLPEGKWRWQKELLDAAPLDIPCGITEGPARVSMSSLACPALQWVTPTPFFQAHDAETAFTLQGEKGLEIKPTFLGGLKK